MFFDKVAWFYNDNVYVKLDDINIILEKAPL